jgi:hypothetical protein
MTDRTPKIIAGVATIGFPILLLVGFVLHPNLLSPSLTTTADDLIAKFRGNPVFHLGHLIVLAAVPLIILSLSYLSNRLTGAGRSWGIAGSTAAMFGAAILAADKGALCTVLSAFDTLNDADFQMIRPALTTIVERRGLLVIFWALPLLPLGAIIQMIGLMKERLVSRTSGIVAIIGLALLNNPDIDIVSSVGALLMCFAYIPLGLRIAGIGHEHKVFASA